MSEYVPFEIQIEIIKKLPIKPLLQFRSVSKSWKSVIDSSGFIANRLKHRVLVIYADYPCQKVDDVKYVSIVDDDSFPQHKFPLILPSCAKQLLGDDNPTIMGISQGVFCFCVNFGEPTYWHYSFNEAKTFVLWNPTIQKSIPVLVPGNDTEFQWVVGFGVCPRTSVPKLVKISYLSGMYFDYINDNHKHTKVEIFSLSSGSCRRSLSVNVPRISIDLDRDHVCVDKCIYWYAFDRTVTRKTKRKSNLILSFDMTTEEFIEIDLCDDLKEEYAGDAYGCEVYLRLSKLGTSLVVLQPKYGWYQEHSVWKMEHGFPNTFTKLFVIKSPIKSSLRINEVLGFRKTGEPIIDTEMTIDNNYIQKTLVYEPKSGEISDIGLPGAGCLWLAQSYIETLVLLDHRGGE